MVLTASCGLSIFFLTLALIGESRLHREKEAGQQAQNA